MTGQNTPLRKTTLPRPLRVIRARPRLFICFMVALMIALMLPWDWRHVTRALIAWNVGAGLYVLLVGLMMSGATHENIRKRAQVEDEGQFTILTLAIIAALASIGAIVAELAIVKELAGVQKTLHILLAAVTIISSFAFIHVMFALHYAHEYYAQWRQDLKKPEGQRGGLAFPATDCPDYIDFLYFSFVIGVASQTADVATTGRTMRFIVLVHGILSFFFNTTVLALTINIAAGLI